MLGEYNKMTTETEQNTEQNTEIKRYCIKGFIHKSPDDLDFQLVYDSNDLIGLHKIVKDFLREQKSEVLTDYTITEVKKDYVNKECL